MKKFLLSSIIMLGVCGAVNAQDASASKHKKNNQVATANAAPAAAPQKAAIMPASDDVAIPATATRTEADKIAAQNAPAAAPQTKAQIKANQAAAQTTTVNAAGVVVPTEEAKLKALKDAEAKTIKPNQQ